MKNAQDLEPENNQLTSAIKTKNDERESDHPEEALGYLFIWNLQNLIIFYSYCERLYDALYILHNKNESVAINANLTMNIKFQT